MEDKELQIYVGSFGILSSTILGIMVYKSGFNDVGSQTLLALALFFLLLGIGSFKSPSVAKVLGQILENLVRNFEDEKPKKRISTRRRRNKKISNRQNKTKNSNQFGNAKIVNIYYNYNKRRKLNNLKKRTKR